MKLYTFYMPCYNNDIRGASIWKEGVDMPSNAEIAKDTIEQFKKIQRYMIIAKKENATETYAELKSEYLSLKTLLNVIGVNLIDIDVVKE